MLRYSHRSRKGYARSPFHFANKGDLTRVRPDDLTAALWITSPLLKHITMAGITPFAALSDAGIAMLASLALFVIPVDLRGTRTMNWATATKLPWGVLMLFGGGLTLAAADAISASTSP